MRVVINRLAALAGAAVAVAGIVFIVLLELKQRGPGSAADAAGLVAPVLIFSLPLAATVIGFVAAGIPVFAKRLSLVSIGLSLGGTLNLLLLLASLPIRGLFPFGAAGMGVVVVLTFGCLLVLPRLKERILVDHVQYTGVIVAILEGLIVMMAVIIGRSAGPLLAELLIIALLIGIGPVLALTNQARRQSLMPGTFIGIWCGAANLFGAAFLGITSVGIYFFMAAIVIVFCGLVVQFTAFGPVVLPESPAPLD